MKTAQLSSRRFEPRRELLQAISSLMMDMVEMKNVCKQKLAGTIDVTFKQQVGSSLASESKILKICCRPVPLAVLF
jgi:hypothetical protein